MILLTKEEREMALGFALPDDERGFVMTNLLLEQEDKAQLKKVVKEGDGVVAWVVGSHGCLDSIERLHAFWQALLKEVE